MAEFRIVRQARIKTGIKTDINCTELDELDLTTGNELKPEAPLKSLNFTPKHDDVITHGE